MLLIVFGFLITSINVLAQGPDLLDGTTGLETCYDKNFVNYDCDDPNLCYDNGMVIDCPNVKIVKITAFILAAVIIIWSLDRIIIDSRKK